MIPEIAQSIESFILHEETNRTNRITSATLVYKAVEAFGSLLPYEVLQNEIRKGVDWALVKLEGSNNAESRRSNIYKSYHNVSIFILS